MCGIWAFLLRNFAVNRLNFVDQREYYSAFSRLKERGPDNSSFIELNSSKGSSPDGVLKNSSPDGVLKLGFHRLAIMDPHTSSNQPFIFTFGEKTVYCLVNGEIYNYKKLIADHNLSPRSQSDCEVLPLLFLKYRLENSHGRDSEDKAFERTLSLIEGEWACILITVESENVRIYAARDKMGVRPLFYSNDSYGIGFSSEVKGLLSVSQKTYPFPPTQYVKVVEGERESYTHWIPWYEHRYTIDKTLTNTTVILDTIRQLVIEAVHSRLSSDRPMGFLLSGGIDSSLVAAIAASFFRETGKRIRTFSIGMPNSPDVYYAQKVAEHIGSIHTVVPFSVEKGLETIPEVIKTIESYDITTVRASTPHYLLAKWISENTDIKVLFSGEYMDEVAGSYLYLHNAPTPTDFHNECVRLLNDIYLFDSLRADRCIAGNGLEARVPFSHAPFIQFYLSIPPELRMPRVSFLSGETKLEKALIREAFSSTGLLPDEIIRRTKNAFSDAISHQSKSWYQYIEEYCEEKVSDELMKERYLTYPFNTPQTKEAFYYRQIFEGEFGNKNVSVIPYMWMPKWCGIVTNPSARILQVYKNVINEKTETEEV